MLEKYITHACGSINNIIYSNSKEALEKNYKKGARFVEIDILLTSDNQYILIHDFKRTRKELFNKEGQMSFVEFKSDKMINNLTQMSLLDILDWLTNHRDVCLVTDSKEIDLAELLEFIKENYPDLVQNIIPQIFYKEQYKKARDLGYKNIIFAFYYIEFNQEMLEFVQNKEFLALSFSKNDINLPNLKKTKHKILLHTVNDLQEKEKLEKKGADYFFSDDLY